MDLKFYQLTNQWSSEIDGFYAHLDLQQAEFTDETAACMEYSEEIFVMLLTHAKYSEFTKSRLLTVQRIQGFSVFICQQHWWVKFFHGKSCQCRCNNIKRHRIMVLAMRSFEDPDGHTWEVFYMDSAQIPQ